jgi:hypothetical protein
VLEYETFKIPHGGFGAQAVVDQQQDDAQQVPVEAYTWVVKNHVPVDRDRGTWYLV